MDSSSPVCSDSSHEGGPATGVFLLASIFLIAVCGIVYELLAGTISSYLVGDSVYQFSIVIGIFMSSMGLGSFLSRFLETKLAEWFIFIEILLGLVGGLSAPVLFFAFARLENYTPFLFLTSVTIGTLVGLELPLLLRLLKKYSTLKILISNVMTADYIGALFASILFPLVFVPSLGLVRTSLLFGLMNVFVGGLGIYVFRATLENKSRLVFSFVSVSVILCVSILFAGKITTYTEDTLYAGEIIFSATTPYQRVIVTKNQDDVRMFINGSIQFCSKDEYRYHESLVLPALAAIPNREKILVIGGGDGLGAREVLKFPDVKSVVLVDIDPAITDLAARNPLMRKLNENALNDPRVKVVNADAWKFLETSSDFYDAAIIDLPDPDDLTISRLYSLTFYRLLARHLSARGIFVTQATSPLYAQKAFWCIFNTISSVENPFREEAKLSALGYHTYVPAFGEWGFIMGSAFPIKWEEIRLAVPTKYLTREIMDCMVKFPPDMGFLQTDINSIDTHQLRAYYEEGWKKWLM